MKAISMKVWGPAVAVFLLLSSAAVASHASPGGQSELAAVRAATAKFHDLATAEAAGYSRFLDCFQNPGVGGMGQHYVQLDSLDGNIDALRPEAMVYEVDPRRLQLVAVEYVVPTSDWSGEDPPKLFGHDFFLNTQLGVWALHAWIWRPNPLGMFENFNPKVRLCP
ncbi:MAG: hypothetical protein E6G44_08150 [Actinobacteria bacterium]|nr:MAG: hypothetical protein E6G44_08150 [Actinomycetota bacterium]